MQLVIVSTAFLARGDRNDTVPLVLIAQGVSNTAFVLVLYPSVIGSLFDKDSHRPVLHEHQTHWQRALLALLA